MSELRTILTRASISLALLGYSTSLLAFNETLFFRRTDAGGIEAVLTGMDGVQSRPLFDQPETVIMSGTTINIISKSYGSFGGQNPQPYQVVANLGMLSGPSYQVTWSANGWGYAYSAESVSATLVPSAIPALGAFVPDTIGTPNNGTVVSGVGVISGYSCNYKDIEIRVDGVSLGKAGAGTNMVSLGDPSLCGRTDVGYSLLVNFNKFSEGWHTVAALGNGTPFAQARYYTIKLQPDNGTHAWASGLSKQVVVNDFPTTGKRATLTWHESYQNFAISSIDDMPSIWWPPAIAPVGAKLTGASLMPTDCNVATSTDPCYQNLVKSGGIKFLSTGATYNGRAIAYGYIQYSYLASGLGAPAVAFWNVFPVYVDTGEFVGANTSSGGANAEIDWVVGAPTGIIQHIVSGSNQGGCYTRDLISGTTTQATCPP